MTRLRIQLLGTFQVLKNGRSLTAFRTDKIRTLLAYLAVESDRPHRRESLAALFWPDMSDQKALSNLRLSLYRLRQTLGDDMPSLQIERHAVRFDVSETWVDVLAFERALAAVSDHSHLHVHNCPGCARNMEAAVTYYRGDFLPGLFPGDSPAFDDWAASWRERMHQAVLLALTWLAIHHQENGRHIQAIEVVRRQLELEPWRESAHRDLIQLLAQCGQQAAALNQYERCHSVLRDELGVTPDAETERLYRKIKAERMPSSPEQKRVIHPVPISPAQRITSFLPVSAAPFVGRQVELDKLDELMGAPRVRLVTITGVGGIGKTRLALACAAAQAARYQERFAHGVFFISLTAVDTTDRLPMAIARSLPFSPEPGDVDPTNVQHMLEYLQNRQLLLVLDNFEQLLDGDEGQLATAFLQDLLKCAPQLKLLVTSRERLHLQIEHTLPLDGLLCPDEQAADYTHFPAVQLFQHRARRIQPDFTLAREDLPALITICDLLAGMPLGLELAAAWVEWLPLSEIASEIESGLDFLVTEMRDWPDRHRSLRGIFDTSWERLSEIESDFLSKLSVFSGGFTRAAALAVAGGPHGRMVVFRLLAALVSKSLLHHDRLIDRYTMHELLRQYSAEKLLRYVDVAGIQRRHATYFCQWLCHQAPNLQGERQKETLVRIESNLENIQLAWGWVAANGMAASLAEAAFGLGMYCLRRSRFTDGTTLFSSAIDGLEALATTQDESHSLARLWYWKAMFEPGLANRQQYLEYSLELMDRAHAPQEVLNSEKAAIFLELGIVANGQGDYTRGDQYFKQSLISCRLAGNQWGEANVLFELGVRTWRNGEYGLAEKWFTQCLDIRLRLGDYAGIAVALEGLVGTAMFSGHTEKALEHLRQSYAVYEDLADQVGTARLKIKQAQIMWYKELGGLSLFEEGLAFLKEVGAHRNVALWTVILAMLQADVDIDSAAQTAIAGQKLCLELGYQRGIAIAQGVLGRVALVKGHYAEAFERADAYLHAVGELSLAVEYTDALIWIGWASLALGNNRQAESYVSEALQTPNYWRVACLDLAAILLAHRSASNCEGAWQILGFAESRYAPHRGMVSQRTLRHFLPQSMQDLPAAKIVEFKAQGSRMDEESLCRQITAVFMQQP